MDLSSWWDKKWRIELGEWELADWQERGTSAILETFALVVDPINIEGIFAELGDTMDFERCDR